MSSRARARTPCWLFAGIVVGALLLTLGPSACASAPAGERPGTPGDASGDVLTVEELRQSHARDLYGAIDERRPRWIRSGRVMSPYGLSSGESVVVYFDHTRQGGPEMLRGIPVEGVSSVRFYSGPAAQQRFGMDHRLGAIVVNFVPTE